MNCLNQNLLAKLLFSLLLLLFANLNTFGQKVDTIYTNQGKLFQVISTDGDKKTIETFSYSGQLTRVEVLKNEKREGPYKEFHSNGRPKEESNYHNGQLEGPYKTFRNNGNPQMDLSYKQFNVEGRMEGLKHGAAKLYHYNGVLSAEGEYDKGKQSGTWLIYNQQGQLSEQKEFKEGKMAGTHIQYHRNGQIQYQAEVFEDVTVNNVHYPKLVKGWVRRYFENGNAEEETEMREDRLTGNQKRWWDNGQLRFEGVVSKNDIRVSKFYDKDGNLSLYLEEKKTIVNGYPRWIKHGVEKRYKGSTLLSETSYKNGKSHGPFKQYNPQGILVSEGSYHKQKAIGPYKLYHDDGRLKAVSQNDYIIYWQGDTGIVANGWQKAFYNNGDPENESLKDMGQDVYTSRYDEEGELKTRSYTLHDITWTQEYYPGGIIKSDQIYSYFYQQKIVWFINGKPQNFSARSNYPMEETFDYTFDGDGNVTRAVVNGKEMDINGDLKIPEIKISKSFYRADVSDGPHKLKYGNGNKRIEINLKNGLPNGSATFYRPDGSLLFYAENSDGLSRGLSYYLSPKGDTLMQQIKGDLKTRNRKFWGSDSSYSEEIQDERGIRKYFYETYPGGAPEMLADEVNKIHKRWTPEGVLTSESKPVNGDLNHTFHKHYYASGKLREKYHQVGAQREGEYWLYHKNEKLHVHCYFKNGKQHGKYERFKDDGNLWSRGELINGKKEGFWLILVDGELVQQFYKNDKRQVSLPENTCGCIDTTQAVGQIKFVPTVKHFIEYRKYKNSHPSFIQPLSEEKYGSLFYRSLYGNGLDLLVFKPLSLNLDQAGENTLTLNRCHTHGYVSAININAYSGQKGLDINIYEPKFQLSFAHDLMYQQKDRGSIRVNISPASARINETDYIKTKNTYEEACFEPIMLGGWQLDHANMKLLPNVKLIDAKSWFGYEPHALPRLPNLPSNFQKTEIQTIKKPIGGGPDTVSKKVFTNDFENQRLIGFVAVNGKGSTEFKGSKLGFELRYLWLTNDWGSGSFDMDLEDIDNSGKITVKSIDGEKLNLSLEELQKTLESFGFSNIKVEQYTKQKKLKIEFWLE